MFNMAKINPNLQSIEFFRKWSYFLHSDNAVKTDINYKETNAHDYLPYNSAHPKHCKGI